jgi:hypothetical protein
MPFDALPAPVLDDLARLHIVRDGVAAENSWDQVSLGGRCATQHCLLGWLLVATDWDVDEAARITVDYLYPALPPSAQKRSPTFSVSKYNDNHGRAAVLRVIDKAMTRVMP